MESFNSLVAGGDQVGFRDGSFVNARFNHPIGLSGDDLGEKLFVADSGNNRIRVIDLKNENNVVTLAGTGKVGMEDGSFDKATFNMPTRLVTLPEDRLAVYDSGSHSIRLIDLKTKSVSTLTKNVVIWDMVYRPQDNSLYFSELVTKSLAKLDLKSLTVTTVFSKSTQVPSPEALCVTKDKFYVADRDMPTVYDVSWPEGKSIDPKSVIFTIAGLADHVVQLAYSGKTLYALQTGNTPLVRVDVPKSTVVSLGTPWGFLINSDGSEKENFIQFQPDQPIGFFAFPQEIHKLLIAQPNTGLNTVIAVTDYAYDQYWKASSSPGSDSVMDYNFPDEKPPNTYRILLAGDSRTFIAPRVIAGSNYDNWFYGAPRTDTMAKQMEMYLNTEAALQGVKTHFQVLEWNRQGVSLSTYAYTEIPPLVKKYKIDLVLALVGSFAYIDYYMCPISKEGVPVGLNDYEYILKPLSQRVPPGVAADFYQRWKKKNPQDTEKLSWAGSGVDCNVEPEMRNDMIEMTGRRLDLLAKKIAAMGTSGGYSPKVVLFHVPFRIWPNDCVVSYWTDVAHTFNLPFLDLSEAYNSLKISYYPTATECCDGHYSAYGSKLIGFILSRYLVEDNYVPFEKAWK